MGVERAHSYFIDVAYIAVMLIDSITWTWSHRCIDDCHVL